MIYQKRRNAFCQLLREEGIDHGVIGSPESVYYLTGRKIMPLERFFGLFLDTAEETWLMIAPAMEKDCMNGKIEVKTYDDAQGPDMLIHECLKGCNHLGTEMGYFTMRTGRILERHCEEISDVGSFLTSLRQRKDEEEVKKLQRAAEIVDESLAYIRSQLREGMTETEISRMLFEHIISYEGVDPDEKIVLVQIGENSAYPHGTAGDRKLRQGDLILFDFCACYEGYWSDITRCLFFGEPAQPKLREIYEIVRRANLTAISQIRPGIRTSEIDRAARAVIEDAGYGAEFLHRTGHGLGMSVHEEPFIGAGNERVLEEGMVFTIEPGIYLEGIGGIRIEDDVLVTAEGARVLTSYSKELEDNLISLHPIADFYMKNGTKITVELLPEAAPNAVNSFISLAKKGCFDHNPLERVVKDVWIDGTFTAFGKEECKYFIPNDLTDPSVKTHPSVKAGSLVMGCYDHGISGCEWGFALRDLPFLDEMCPVFGIVRSGMEELVRIGGVETEELENRYEPKIKLTYPKEPEIVDHIEIETFGITYPEPEKILLSLSEQPPNWNDVIYYSLFR